MALGKRIKIGGGYYKGYKVAVAGGLGDYSQVIVEAKGYAMNAISVVPDFYGAGDTMSLKHHKDAAGAGAVIAILAEDINNVGANASVQFDFPAAELINAGESVKFIYTNAAGVAGNVYLVVELVGIKKTV